jgi:hypothetical protein
MNSRDGREGHAGDFRMVGEIIVGGSRQRGHRVPRDRAVWAHPEHVANELYVQHGFVAAELQQERVRLGNRIRQQLWRYYPQLLELTDDVTAEWVLELCMMAPTPAKAARLREATLARLLKQHRIRKIISEAALSILRAPVLKVAAGLTEAAVLHLWSLVARLTVLSCH